MEALYTISEVADKLGLSTKTLRRWEETGKFVGSRTMGGQRRYTLSDLHLLDAIKHGVIPNMADLLTLEEAAHLCGVSASTFARWEESGKVHPLIAGGSTFYSRSSLMTKLESLKPEVPRPHFTSFTEVDVTQAPSPTPTVAPPPVTPNQAIPNTSSQRSITIPLPIIKFPIISWPTVLLNIVITITTLLFYHIAFARPPESISPQGSVQGVETTRDPSLILLDSIMDQSKTLRPMALVTPIVRLAPTSEPTTANPGALYFDAGSQSLKLFRDNTWTDIMSPSIQTSESSLVSGTTTLDKGKNQLTVTDNRIGRDSHIIVTPYGDYSPAKKHWLNKGVGSFTLHTDFPVGQSVTFGYLIMNPV